MKSRVLEGATDYNQRIGETFEDAQTETFRMSVSNQGGMLTHQISYNGINANLFSRSARKKHELFFHDNQTDLKI